VATISALNSIKKESQGGRRSTKQILTTFFDKKICLDVINWPVGAMVARGPPKTEVEGSSPLLVVLVF
jgi:hypothetical protein